MRTNGFRTHEELIKADCEKEAWCLLYEKGICLENNESWYIEYTSELSPSREHQIELIK